MKISNSVTYILFFIHSILILSSLLQTCRDNSWNGTRWRRYIAQNDIGSSGRKRSKVLQWQYCRLGSSWGFFDHDLPSGHQSWNRKSCAKILASQTWWKTSWKQKNECSFLNNPTSYHHQQQHNNPKPVFKKEKIAIFLLLIKSIQAHRTRCPNKFWTGI